MLRQVFVISLAIQSFSANAATVHDAPLQLDARPEQIIFAENILSMSLDPQNKVVVNRTGLAFRPHDYAHFFLLLVYAGLFVANLPGGRRAAQTAAAAMSRTR